MEAHGVIESKQMRTNDAEALEKQRKTESSSTKGKP